MTVLTTLIPELRGRAAAFARAVLRRRATGRRCTVRAVAASLGVTARTLRKHWPGSPMPAPKDLLDWTTLLFTSYTHEWSGQAWGRIAGACGMAEDTLRRQRAKRFGSTASDDASDFARVVLAMAEAVEANRHRRELALNAVERLRTAS